MVVFRVMQAAEGKLRLKGNWVEVLPKSANYALLYVTCGVVAAVVIAALLLGGLAVLLSALAPRFIFCPAWLCGWAIGLTILSPVGFSGMGSLPLQIGAAMLVGVWYVGVFLNLVQKRLVRLFTKHSDSKR